MGVIKESFLIIECFLKPSPSSLLLTLAYFKLRTPVLTSKRIVSFENVILFSNFEMVRFLSKVIERFVGRSGI